jgi:hypothetical protein
LGREEIGEAKIGTQLGRGKLGVSCSSANIAGSEMNGRLYLILHLLPSSSSPCHLPISADPLPPLLPADVTPFPTSCSSRAMTRERGAPQQVHPVIVVACRCPRGLAYRGRACPVTQAKAGAGWRHSRERQTVEWVYPFGLSSLH